MGRVERTAAGLVFRGWVERDDDLRAAGRLAGECGAYAPDDEDEDPVGGAVNCFGCRYRRWVPDGFTCMKDRLPSPG